MGSEERRVVPLLGKRGSGLLDIWIKYLASGSINSDTY